MHRDKGEHDLSGETWVNSSTEELAAMLGLTATSRLMALYAEELVDIPTDSQPGHPLEKLLGKPACWRLRAEFGGKTLRVPLNTEADRISLIRAIAGWINRGLRVKDIAKLTGLSPPRIRRHIACAWELGLLDDKKT